MKNKARHIRQQAGWTRSLARAGYVIFQSKMSKKSKKQPRFSWHFWFINIVTLFAFLFGLVVGIGSEESQLLTSLILAVLVYVSLWFQCIVRNLMSRELMLKFYVKT